MPVEKTESRLSAIPAAMEALGPVFTNGSSIVVSYLPQPIQNREQHFIVFPDTTLHPSVNSYSWTINNNGTPLSKNTSSGVLSYIPTRVGDLSVTVEIRDAANSVLSSVSFETQVFPTDEILAKFISNPGSNVPEAAHPPTTTEIINDLADYVEDMVPKIIMEEFNRLILSLAYASTLEITASKRNKLVHEANKLLNTNRTDEWVTAVKTGMGVCRIRPFIAGMYLEKSAGNNFLAFAEVPEKKADQLLLDKQQTTDFNTATEEERLDLHNKLRFPKSNLAACKLILEALQAQYFPGETFTEILTDKAKATQLIDQFLSGPKVFSKASGKSKQIFALMQSRAFQIPRQRPFIMFDHTLTEDYSFATDSFQTNPRPLSPNVLVNDFYNPSQPEILNTDPALQAKLDAIIDKPAFTNLKQDFTIAITDLSGAKHYHPTFAGWLPKRNMYAASSAKIGILYATYQLRADVNEFLRNNPAITTMPDLLTAIKEVWRLKSIPTTDYPDVNAMFDLDTGVSPARVKFKAAVTAHQNHISSNSDPSALRTLVGFRFLGSCLLQSGLFNTEDGGIWLGLSYDGNSWSGNPYKGFASHNINALGGNLFFTLIAQLRLVSRSASIEMQNNLILGGCYVALNVTVPDLQHAAAKCGFFGDVFHNFVYVETTTNMWVIAIMTKNNRTTIIQPLFDDLVTALST